MFGAPRVPSMVRLVMGGPYNADGQVVSPDEFMLDEVDAWHMSRYGGVPLHQWLGMNPDEYSRWVKDPACLEELLAARRKALGVGA